MFDGNLGTVTITDGEITKTYTDMWLMSNLIREGRSWFVLGEKTAQQKTMERIEKLLASMADSRVTALEDKLSAMEAAYIEGVQNA